LPPELLKTTEDILDQLSAGKTVESVPAELQILFRPSVQPYLISWLRYDPAKEIAKLSIPVLIVQGTTDLQASPEDAKRLLKGNPAAKLLFIEGMNHVLKTVPNEQKSQVSSYGDPTLPVAADLIGVIVSLRKRTESVRHGATGRVIRLLDCRLATISPRKKASISVKWIISGHWRVMGLQIGPLKEA
jgi:uncharacterized protein